MEFETFMSDDQQDQQADEPSIEEILDSIRQIISDDDGSADETAADKSVVAESNLDLSAQEEADVREANLTLSGEEKVDASGGNIDIAAEGGEDSEAVIDLTEKLEDQLPEDIDLSAEEEIVDEVNEAQEEGHIEIDMLDAEEDVAPVSEEVSAGDIDDIFAKEDDGDEVLDVKTEVADDVDSAYEEIASNPDKIERKPQPASDIIADTAENIAVGAFSELAQKAKIDKSGNITVEDIVRAEIRPMLRSWIDAHLSGIVERLLQEELERISKKAMEE